MASISLLRCFCHVAIISLHLWRYLYIIVYIFLDIEILETPQLNIPEVSQDKSF